MRHWTEVFDDDDADEQLVRPYTITSGRTSPERADLTLITLVTTVPEGATQALAVRRMQPEHRTILVLCREPKAVVEVSAELGLPVVLTKILIGDLVDSGQVWARSPRPFTQRGELSDMAILEAVRDGLRKL